MLSGASASEDWPMGIACRGIAAPNWLSALAGPLALSPSDLNREMG